jgi:ribosome biogenesis GTPase
VESIGEFVSKFQDFDEDDIRQRPGKHKSRPRTKDRPSHKNSITGIVITVDRGRFTVNLKNSNSFIYAIKARDLGRKGVVVGDSVELVGVDENNPENMARIIKVNERRNALSKSSDDIDSNEKVLVSNVDNVAIVTSTTNPEPNTRLIDRTIIASKLAGAKPFIIATKTDLKNEVDLIKFYEPLNIKVIPINKTSNLDKLNMELANKTTVFVGPSGVGKSSLVNRIVPEANRRTGDVNEVTGRGKHTSTSAYALSVNKTTWIIDTPGIRTFGLAHVEIEQILAGFPELLEFSLKCQKNCNHLDSSCEIEKNSVNNSHLLARLDSLRRLLLSLEQNID